MWSLSEWRRQRILAQHPVAAHVWHDVRQHLSILDGLDDAQDKWLREHSVLFLQDKHLTPMPGVELTDEGRLLLAAQAQLPLLNLGELDWYQGFHEIVLYPDDFISPQRHRDSSGVEHEWQGTHSGEAWEHGPVVLAWPGVLASGRWEGYNLVIHELAHKLDMLNGAANGMPPLHSSMHVSEWTQAMQHAYDHLNHYLDHHAPDQAPIDPYAAENPAEFFAVTSEYFFSAPDLLTHAYPKVYQQLSLFYRQDPLTRLQTLQSGHPEYREPVNRA